MSNAKLCDGCGSIYPENMEGSESGVGSMRSIRDGKPVDIQATRDFCADCVTARASAVRPFSTRQLTGGVLHD